MLKIVIKEDGEVKEEITTEGAIIAYMTDGGGEVRMLQLTTTERIVLSFLIQHSVMNSVKKATVKEE